jgi:hypothetical protein
MKKRPEGKPSVPKTGTSRKARRGAEGQRRSQQPLDESHFLEVSRGDAIGGERRRAV